MNTNITNFIESQTRSVSFSGAMPSTLDKEDIILHYSNKHINIKTSPFFNDGNNHRLSMIIPYIKNFISNHNPKQFFTVIALGDTINANYDCPTLCFSKNKKNNSILIPNIDFFSGVIYQVLKESSKDKPYEQKKDGSIFAGSSTGPFKNNTRILFGQKTLQTNNHKCIIHNLCQADRDNWLDEYPFVEKILGAPQSITNQLDYKIVTNIDGNTMCWSRLYWQINSNSIPVYVNKNIDEIQFFDAFDMSGCYIETDLDNCIEVMNNIIDTYDIDIINSINKSGQNFCNEYFEDYLTNPQEFLQQIINHTLSNIIN